MIHSLNDEEVLQYLLNVYNLNSTSIIFIKESSIILQLNELVKNDYEQLIIRNFNLHYWHWKDRRCFIQYAMMNNLLNIIINECHFETTIETRHNYLWSLQSIHNDKFSL